MSSPVFKGTIKNICNGTGINNLTNQNFDSVYMPCPNTAILKKYNANITPLFEKIGNLDAEIEMLNIKRDELLPLLMTGQVSVKQLNNDLASHNIIAIYVLCSYDIIFVCLKCNHI